MALFSQLWRKIAGPSRQEREARLQQFYKRTLKAKYDAAQLSPQMENWWINSDGLSARAAASKDVRTKIRQRARYEVHESGSYANGILQAMLNAVIGVGPTLQVRTDNKEFNTLVEEEWAKYAKEINLCRKLRTMYAAKLVDGEAFAERVIDRRMASPVKFDWILSEADLWTNPAGGYFDPDEDDGIFYSRNKPVRYMRLKEHPGDPYSYSLETDTISARYVVHWFAEQRPGQRRGVSEYAPTLQPLARMRRYRLAVLAAGDTAANHAAVMYSTASHFSEEPAALEEDFDLLSLPNNAMLTLPEGWQIAQLKAEQPHTAYVEFIEEQLSATARPFQMPLNVVIGSSRNHNFASAKLDWMQFKRANEPKRKDCEDSVLNRLVGAWLWGAARVPDYLPLFPASSMLPEIPIVWQWPVDDPIDVEAQASADTKLWATGLLTDEAYCKRYNIDIDDFYAELQRQHERRTDIGAMVPMPGVNTSHSFTEQPQEGDLAI